MHEPNQPPFYGTAKKGECFAQVWTTDCLDYLINNANPSEKFPLVIADPPYNQGMDYADYADNKTASAYLARTKQWLTAVCDALHPRGSLWIFAPDEWVSEIDLMARKDLSLCKRRHVVWAFTFGQAAQKNFSRSHAHILYLTKNKTRFTFNSEVLRVPSARQLVYKDKRANGPGKLPDATWMLLREQLEPHMTPDRDTWLESRICGTFKERKKHSPNQIPVPLLERIIRATSNPGDLVFDPFLGAGSTGVAALRCGRSFIGCDVSETCARESLQRLAATAAILD